MFERFGAKFRVAPTGQARGAAWRDPRLASVEGYTELVERFAGCTFEDGLYRLDDDLTGPLHDAALAAGFFTEWMRSHPADVPLKRHECVGYRVPLFLGGKDSVDNLKTIDMDVYWSLCGQLRRGTRRLPEGTSIRELEIHP